MLSASGISLAMWSSAAKELPSGSNQRMMSQLRICQASSFCYLPQSSEKSEQVHMVLGTTHTPQLAPVPVRVPAQHTVHCICHIIFVIYPSIEITESQ
jgi:hypothetical protein